MRTSFRRAAVTWPLVARAILALATASTVATTAVAAQDYPYSRVPPVLYVVGKPDWTALRDNGSGARSVTLYKEMGQALAAAGGQPVYRILRHTFGRDDNPSGNEFLKQVQAGRSEDGPFEYTLRDAGALEKLHSNSKPPGELGPVNPHWATTGPYQTKPMQGEYRPEAPKDDLKNGRFYFPTEGSQAAIDYMEKFQLHFGKDADGNTILMRRNDAGGLMPLDTRNITSDVPPGQCLFVMDAQGNIYVLAREWVIGIKALGFDGINHSSIPAGHAIAAAGKMEVHNGKLVLIDNSSGHYRPDNMHLKQAMAALQQHSISKGAYHVSFKGDDHPGRSYLELDAEGETKKFTTPDPETAPTGERPHGDLNAKRPAEPDDPNALKPEETVNKGQLEVDRRAAETPAAPVRHEPDKPDTPPDPALVEDIRKRLEAVKDVEKMDVNFVKQLYALDPKAAKAIGEAVSKGGLDAHNMKLGQIRKRMDLEVWKKILSQRKIHVEVTNAGKNNGARSDYDYTLYHVAEEAGVDLKELIAEHQATWKSLHQLDPSQVEIKVMNGDEFYPDWRNESISSAEHEIKVREILGELRLDPEKYGVPGANKEQVHNRPLRSGNTEIYGYDESLDKPDIPIERQLIRDSGPTREISRRYQGVQDQYNRMNALGNLIQNKQEFFGHTGDHATDATRRAKYFNRVIDEGLGNNRFFANTYAQILASNAPNKEQLKADFLQLAFGTKTRDVAHPELNSAQVRHYAEVIDISMRIEADKKVNADFMAKREDYFASKYRQNAEAFVDRQIGSNRVTPDERKALVLGEMQRLFEHDQKFVLAEAILAGLRQSVARDLTPEGVLRNRVRFDEKTGKFVTDPEGAKKVASERALEVALFFELANSLPDGTPFESALKANLKSRAMSTAPNEDVRGFYEALDKVNAAEIDKYVRGDPENRVQKSMDDLRSKREKRILELLVERKEKAAEFVRQKGVRADPNSVTAADVQAEILQAQSERMNPSRRTQLRQVATALGTRLGGDFKEALVENGSALMVGSSAVNLVRAWQESPEALGFAAFTEAINYMPDYIQTPFTVVDLLAKVKRGEYVGAGWQASLFAAMSMSPGLGHAMLAYNIATGSLDIVHTHFVTRIDKDLVEQAIKSRVREEDGSPLPDTKRARGNRFPDFKESVYNGSGPGFPLFYGRYVKAHGQNTAPEYLDGTVPQDFLSDFMLADTAAIEFAPQIDSILRASGATPGSPTWAQKAWDLKLKYGFDIPFYRRMWKVYDEKYHLLTYYENWPSPFNKEYLEECRLDVYDWYVNQPPGYKLELKGDASFWFGDQTDKMQEMIARECAVILGSIHEIKSHADELDRSNLEAFKAATKRGFDAERALIAAQRAVEARIKADEEKATREIERKALELAEKHETQFALTYPWTYATEEDLAWLNIESRTLNAKVKEPTSVDLSKEFTGPATEGAPAGWRPGPMREADFKPDKDGWVAYRPLTVPVRFTAKLLDADKKPVATSTLDLPVVLYAPTFSGTVSVKVYGLTAKGDSSEYAGALATLGSETQETDALSGVASFYRLKAGAHSVKVAPARGDARHGPGSGSASIVDLLLSKDKNGKESARIVVKLPYIPEPVVAKKDSTTTKTGTGTGTGTGISKADSVAIKNKADSVAKARADSVAVAAVEAAVSKLGPLTAKAEKARNDARAACRYQEAATQQQQIVSAAKSFISSTFPKGAPPEVLKLSQAYDAELEALNKMATGEKEAQDHLRKGRAFVLQKKGEPALNELEAASKVENIPPCLYDQVMATYNELKADIEKRILIIDKAVDAANNKCDYATAKKFGEEVEAIDGSLSWVVNELPRIKGLAKRQDDAKALALQAEQKAALAEQAAGAGNMALAESLFNEAIALANQALAQAPACDKQNYSDGVTAMSARKDAVTNPKVDQSLVLLLDTSGSMGSGGKIESAKQAATDAVKSLGPGTEVALISYDGGCAGGYRVVSGFSTNHGPVIAAIAGLSPGGGTPTAPAIGFAHDYMKKNAKGKSAQIVLMTDGQNDCGSMTDAGSGLRNSNIPVRLDAVGFGLDPNSQATKDLSDIVRASGGGGSTYSANSSAELISAFRRAFITSQVKPRDPTVSGAGGSRLADLFAAAINALRSNDMRGAVSGFKSAVDQFPNSPAAQFNASLAYEAAGQPLQALNHAEKYLSLAPNAFDAGTVRERVGQLRAEQANNPRAIYAPNDCSVIYRWAQREVRAAGNDAARRAKVYDIMTTAQRGDCGAAEKSYEGYVNLYVKKPG